MIGLGLALILMFRGYLPDLKHNAPSMDESPETPESALIESDQTKDDEPKKPRYDFFSLLRGQSVHQDSDLERSLPLVILTQLSPLPLG